MTEKTKVLFTAYEKIREKGRYNMFTDARHIFPLMGLDISNKTDIKTYLDIMEHYTQYKAECEVQA